MGETSRRKPISRTIWTLALALGLPPAATWAQRVPNESENIDCLIVYGAAAAPALGDDDHVQTLFFSVPLERDAPVYIRIYDPDIGGKHDEIHGAEDTYMRYSVYGGNGAFSHPDAQRTDPMGAFKSGSLLFSKVFGTERQYDAAWATLAALNPLQGEKSAALNGYIFKVIIEGVKGNDGNRYRCFLSDRPDLNRAVGGANAFAYEYTFSLPQSTGISHIYPFIDPLVTAVTQSNFDMDKNGETLIYSVTKNRRIAKVSGDAEWVKSTHTIDEEEKNTTIDIQIHKSQLGENAMSFYVTNQYDQAIPFFAIPIGGPPKYKYNPSILLKPVGAK